MHQDGFYIILSKNNQTRIFFKPFFFTEKQKNAFSPPRIISFFTFLNQF